MKTKAYIAFHDGNTTSVDDLTYVQELPYLEYLLFLGNAILC